MLKTSGLAAAAVKPSVIAIGLASNEPPRFVAAMGEVVAVQLVTWVIWKGVEEVC